MAKVLVIDDDPRLRYILQLNLEAADFQVLLAADGATGLALARDEQPDIVILDLMMPVMDGFNVCRTLREERGYPDCSILMLTARDAIADKGTAFQAGVDDYLVKPFDPREVVWRCEALHRRLRRPHLPEDTIVCGQLELLPATLEARLPHGTAKLTRTEFDLLLVLVESAGHVVPTDTLATRLWGTVNDHSVGSLRVQVNRLRQHLEPEPLMPRYLRTARGRGYVLDTP